MDSNRPLSLPTEHNSNRQTCIILLVLSLVPCMLTFISLILLWFLMPQLFSFDEIQIPQQPVPEQKRFQFFLYSVAAPEGSGWMYRPLKNGISFEHQEGQENRMTFASAWLERVDPNTNFSSAEFLAYACAYQGSPIKEDQYTEQQKECDWWEKSSVRCVQLHALYDHQDNPDQSSSAPLLLDSYTLACRHPDFYNAFIFMNYSQQAEDGAIHEDLAKQADTFFMDMGMNSPPGTPPAGFDYEMSPEIKTSTPGTNLAYRKPVKASRELDDFPAWMAVDGLDTNWWGAGARPPQWIEIDLGGNYVVGEIRLLTSQSPAGGTIHQVLARGKATEDQYVLVHTFDGFTVNDQSLVVNLPEALQGVRYIRVETTYTPSWVGWREIEVIAEK